MCLSILVLFAFISSGVTFFSFSCIWLITHKTVKFESKVTCRDGGVGSILWVFICWLCCKCLQSWAEGCEVPGAVIENIGVWTFKGRMWLRLQWLSQCQWVVLSPCGSQKSLLRWVNSCAHRSETAGKGLPRTVFLPAQWPNAVRWLLSTAWL